MAEGNRVTARVTMRSTHSGELQGIAPTGKRVEVRAIDMFRIENGKIVEHWGHLGTRRRPDWLPTGTRAFVRVHQPERARWPIAGGY